jgi:heme/copper-type cytochrome/quinol oxidase subunit 3
MSEAAMPAAGHDSHDEVLVAHGTVLNLQIPNGKICIWLFLGSELMFFTGLIGAYIVIRGGQGFSNWPNPYQVLNVPLTAINTFFLICSSVSVVWGLQGIQAGDRRTGNLGLLLATLFGAIFVGVQCYEYAQLYAEGFRPDTNIFGSCFYTMTGFHGLHVFVGVVALAILTIMGYMGKFNHKNYQAVEYTGLYWHFVELVWIVLFSILYLM